VQYSGNKPKDPLVLTQQYEFIYPTTRGVNTVTVPFGETIYIGCPVGKLRYNNAILTEGFFTCQGNTWFLSHSAPYPTVDFNMITCPKPKYGPVRLTVREVPKSDICLQCETCTEQNIGYVLPSHTFLNIITVCFRPSSNRAYYSKHKLTQYIVDRNLKSPPFQDTSGNYDGYDLKTLYSYTQQELDLKGSFPINEEVYLNRGHLAPVGDFVYRFQKYATIDYLNVAPQWKQFNRISWGNLEILVRNMSIVNSLDFDVYTGTLDTLNHNLTDGNDTHRIEIPKWFWKCIPQLKYLFLGLNNVFVDSAEAERQATIVCNSNVINIKTILPNFSVNDANTGFVFLCQRDGIRHPQLRALMKSILSTS
jgi:DNA/RNA endonuclease G (NUC1)